MFFLITVIECSINGNQIEREYRKNLGIKVSCRVDNLQHKI